MSDILSLNPDQSEAAMHRDGPLLLLAGPGTGKTATLTARIKVLVESGIKESEILAITFTQAASQEMLDRVEIALGHTPGCTIGTFHKVAMLLHGMYPSAFTRLNGRRLIDDAQCQRLVRDIARGLIRKEAGRVDRVAEEDIDALTSDIMSVKDRLTGTEAHHRLPDISALAQAGYTEYQAQLDQERGYDFADLILAAVDALGQHKVHRSVITRWKYVLVDEYQDINPAQHEMIRRLLGPQQNLWAVGDDDQALYGWRQADVRLLLGFAEEYPGARILNLKENYRCPASIMWMANKLIRNNRLRFPKQLRAIKPPHMPIVVHRAVSERSEAVWIARQISRALEKGAHPSDFVILGRVSSLLPPVARALAMENIRSKVRGAPPFWSRPPVRMAVSLLAALLGDWPTDVAPVKPWMLERAQNGVRNRQYSGLIEYVVDFLKATPPANSKVGESKVAWDTSLDDFLTEARLADSPEALMVRMRVDEDDDGDAVTLCTIHASKGLQWPHVFVCGMEVGIMPSGRSVDLEEERRIAYVAITRASVSLTLTSAEERNRVEHDVSPYVGEMVRTINSTMAPYVVDAKGLPYQ